MTTVKEHIFKEIVENLQDISYGTLLITIHNNEITQLDVTKKTRFNHAQEEVYQETTKRVK